MNTNGNGHDPFCSPSWKQAAREYYQERQGKPWLAAAASEDALGSVKLAGIDPKPVEWLWPGRIATGKLTLLAGDPGLGKSQIATYIAARITGADEEWPDGGQAPLGNVVILSAEDDIADTIRPRFEAAGANLDRVQVITGVRTKENGRRTFSLQADLALLGAKIREFGNVRLVIIDPITCYCGKVDGNSTTDIRGLLAPLNEFAEHYRVAVIAISHPPKSAPGGKALYAVTGSLAWIAAARTAFTVAEDADMPGRRLFLNSKNNLAPLAAGIGYRLVQRIGQGMQASYVDWDNAPVTVTADQALAATAGGSETGEAGRDAEEFLREFLAGGPMPAKGRRGTRPSPWNSTAYPQASSQEAGGHCTTRVGRARWEGPMAVVPAFHLQGGHQPCKGATQKSGTLARFGTLAKEPGPPSVADGQRASLVRVSEQPAEPPVVTGAPKASAVDYPEVPSFLIRPNPPALGPPGDSLDDFR
jgi:AAA domain